MFDGCTLTDESIHNIASGLNRLPSDMLGQSIGIGTRSVPLFDSTLKDIGIMKEKGWNPVCDGIYSDGISYTPWEHQQFYLCTSVSEMANCDPDYKTNYIDAAGVWNEHLSDLVDGSSLFYFAADGTGYGLTAFNADLSSLTNGTSMFASCYELTAFNSNLNSLTNGYYMFYCGRGLSNFNVKLSSLTNGNQMFSNCENLTTFNSDLSSLTNGYMMFNGCYNLTAFNADLSSLTNGSYMFASCKLDTASVQNIADTIKDVESLTNGTFVDGEIYKQIDIGISNSTPNEQEIAAFNKIASKGWIIYVGGNGGGPSEWNPTSLIPIDGEETVTPIPFYAKPAPATEETASYIDADGNYYNILGGNYIYGDDLSTYGMFTCEEDAAANMCFTKIEK